MSSLRLQGATINGASLSCVIDTPSFASYVRTKRTNGDGTHLQIINGCTATDDSYQDMLDHLFGIENLSDIIASGGRLVSIQNSFK